MEVEYFARPGADEQWYRYWIEERHGWYVRYGIRPERLLVVRAQQQPDALWCAEQILRSGACACLLVWLPGRQAADYPDLRSGVQLIFGLSGGGRNADIQFNIVGPDLGKLSAYSDQLIEKLRGRQGLVDLDTTLSNRKPELQAHIDRAKASQFGLCVNDIANALHTLVEGQGHAPPWRKYLLHRLGRKLER